MTDITQAVETLKEAVEWGIDIEDPMRDRALASLDTLVARIAELEGQTVSYARHVDERTDRVLREHDEEDRKYAAEMEAENAELRAALEKVQADMDSILQLAESLSPEKEK